MKWGFLGIVTRKALALVKKFNQPVKVYEGFTACLDKRLKLNDLSTDELNVFFAKMEEYCKDNDCEIISKADLAELKLSYAQNSLLAIFQELIDKSFSENK